MLLESKTSFSIEFFFIEENMLLVSCISHENQPTIKSIKKKKKKSLTFLTLCSKKKAKTEHNVTFLCNFLKKKCLKNVYFLLQLRIFLSYRIQVYFYSSIISSHGYCISESHVVMIMLCKSCHKIHSSLYENCKENLFNITTMIRLVLVLKVNQQINLTYYNGSKEDLKSKKKLF